MKRRNSYRHVTAGHLRSAGWPMPRPALSVVRQAPYAYPTVDVTPGQESAPEGIPRRPRDPAIPGSEETMRRAIVFLLALAILPACAPTEDGAMDDVPTGEAGPYDEIPLGPVDGLDLPPTDLDRVQEGDVAPDFTLTSLAGPPVTLSSYRGEANVVLVFYRGHW